jgi:hypothetical protein
MSKDTGAPGRKAATASRKAQAGAKKQAGKAGNASNSAGPSRTPKKDAAQNAPHSDLVDWADAFLNVFRERGNVRSSCIACKIGRSTVYERLERDPAFRQAFQDAREDAADRLEDEAWRRAHDGIESKIFSKDGDEIGTEVKYSDTLLIVLLKANRPGKFSERYKVNDTDVDNEIDRLMAKLASSKEADPS